MIPKTPDGRVLFAVPWQEHVLVGTTDTPVKETTLEPRALEEEIEFILAQAGKYIIRPPTRADVLSVYAGLRPLVNHGAVSGTAALSRDHTIEVSKSGLITITGGKWTTYRKMAEDVITQAEKSGSLPTRPCLSANLPLDDTASAEITALTASEPSLAQRLHPRLPYLRAHVVWAARETMARTIEDVLARRTRALFIDARASIEAAEEVANLLAAELGWSTTEQAARVREYRAFAQGYLLPTDHSGSAGPSSG
jgi:glycerol-3-phosphate dehydrogenase